MKTVHVAAHIDVPTGTVTKLRLNRYSKLTLKITQAVNRTKVFIKNLSLSSDNHNRKKKYTNITSRSSSSHIIIQDLPLRQ